MPRTNPLARLALIFTAISILTLSSPTYSRQVISTIAGGGLGDGLPATLANLSYPTCIAFDGAGNIYFGETGRVRKIGTNGVITTFAGGGVSGIVGDGGLATGASLGSPDGLAIDKSGNLYIADSAYHRVRKVDTRGIITTIAGNGSYASSPDGGAAVGSGLQQPYGVAVDGAGNVYFSEMDGNRIRKVGPNGILSTVAGGGQSTSIGDGRPAINALLNAPSGIAFDSAGNLYIADSNNHRVRKVDTSGVISTVAGTGIAAFNGDGMDSTKAHLNLPTSVAIDRNGNLLISDSRNTSIRKVDNLGAISTIAGRPGVLGFEGDGSLAVNAVLGNIQGVSLDSSGNIFLADSRSARIRKINSDGIIVTVAGNGSISFGGDGGQATNSRLDRPGGIALDKQGNIYIADTYNHRIRQIDPSGLIRTVAGNGETFSTNESGNGTSVSLYIPQGLAVDNAGNLYIADTGKGRIRKLDSNGLITTIAGGSSSGFSGDNGPASNASLNRPTSLAVDADGNVYVSDSGNLRVRRIDKSGTITTVAGNGSHSYPGDGLAATSVGLGEISGIAIDKTGSLYIAATEYQRVWKVDTRGIISTVAGSNVFNFGDQVLATKVSLGLPLGLTIDDAGNLYVAENSNNTIRKIDTKGLISNVAGVGRVLALNGDGGAAISARLENPGALAVDRRGNIFVADTDNNRIRKISPGYQGAWWAGASENGWGLSLIQQGGTLAIGWYYFNERGEPTWAIVPGCTWDANFTNCSGNVTTSSGTWLGSYTGILSQTIRGTATISFENDSTGTLKWNVDGVQGTKSISKLSYSVGASPSGVDYSDVWWGGQSQNGWGLSLLQQGSVIAGAWYTYNQQNQPTWYLINGSNWTSNNQLSVSLIRAKGSPLIGATYDPTLFVSSTAGSATLFFWDANNAIMSYTVDGVTQSKSISRLRF